MSFDSGDAEAERLATEVIDAVIEVHSQIGPALQEAHYENALCRELDLRKVPYQRQVEVTVEYKDIVAGKGRIDLLVGGRLVVELKAVETMLDLHVAQLISYLRMLNLRLGLVVNFTNATMKGQNALRRVLNKYYKP